MNILHELLFLSAGLSLLEIGCGIVVGVDISIRMIETLFLETPLMPSAIIDTEGNVLTATAWQDICTKFHRVNPETEKSASRAIFISKQGSIR